MLLPVLLYAVISASSALWADPGEKDVVLNQYFSNEYIELKLKALRRAYPDKITIRSLGKTPGGHEMWSCVITNNVTQWKQQGKPGVKYVANMHGNEVRGRSLLLKFATFLCEEDNAEILDLLNRTVIHLVPTMNPDGFKKAEEGSCMANEGRYTNGGVDLNRDFPDHWHSGTKLKFAEETKLIMEYSKEVDASLSINFHDGSLVVNYPWDASSTGSSLRAGDYSASPDDAQFKHLALTYAKNHPVMQTADAKCSDSQRFDKGITNGNQWYPVNNGMQDWNYFYQDCFEVTVELGCCKFPKGGDYFNKETWQQNINSLLEYTKQVNLMGITGTVKDMKGNPIIGAKISVVGIDKDIEVKHSQGHYWRLLVAGKYNITASKDGYYPLSFKSVRVHDNKQTLRNFILMSATPQVRKHVRTNRTNRKRL